MSANLPLPSVSATYPPHSELYTSKRPMAIIDLTVEIPSSVRLGSSTSVEKPAPRWRTMEYRIYLLFLAIMVPVMAWIPMSLSRADNQNYPFFEHRLSNGWIPGRKIDNSDAQYRSFRDNIPILTGVAAIFLLLKQIFVRTINLHFNNTVNKLALIPFNLVFSVIFVMVLHGTSIIKIFAILTANYFVAKLCAGTPKLGPISTWVFNGVVLLLNDRYNGYLFRDIWTPLEYLDSLQGFYPRWHIGYNITMLRLISFNMDYYWACRNMGAVETQDQPKLSDKLRKTTIHPKEFYNYSNYIAYILYAPLYIAGPIITFNDFLWQLRRPSLINHRFVFNYAMRLLVCIFTMELILHYMYLVAIKDTKAWSEDTPAELSLIGFWNLMIVWLKLLIPWRFFRLWALADGIDPPENMIRCVMNNYSTMGFWRSWHRSYNLWIIRYIYIPAGGARNALVNTILVFTFVALWHDLTFKLLAWGWLVSLFVIPELLARYFFPPAKFGAKWWYRHLCAFGAVLNIFMMISANLVGFVIGTDGLKHFVEQLFGTFSGIRFLLVAYIFFFVLAQVMFEYREEEMRHNIYRRC